MNKNQFDYYNQFALKNYGSHEKVKEKKILLEQKNQSALVKENAKDKPGKKKLITILILIATFVILYFIANAFSNLLAFSTVSIYDSKTISVNSYTKYLVEINEFEKESDAKNLANEMKLRGGAGAVIYDTMYKVIVSSYDNLIDAQTICDKIKNEFNTCKVYTLNINRIKLSGNNSEAIKELKDCLTVFKTTGEELNKYALMLDSGEESSLQIKNDLISLHSNITALSQVFSNYSKNFNDSKFVITQAKIDQVIAQLQLLINTTLSSSRFSAEIKLSAINCFLLQNELAIMIA